MQTESVPEFIEPPNVAEWTDDKIEKHLEGIRERRMKAHRIYTATMEEKARVQETKAREQLEKQCEMLRKNIEALDRAIERVEDRASKIRGLRLQLGVDG